MIVNLQEINIEDFVAKIIVIYFEKYDYMILLIILIYYNKLSLIIKIND